MNLPGYESPEEAVGAAIDASEKSLGAVVAILVGLANEKANIHRYINELDVDEDEDEIQRWGERIKQIKSEESSWHRIESGLQSRLKVGMV
jgi:hypothetical protein